MVSNINTKVRLDVAAEQEFAAAVEAWLRTQSQPEVPLTWIVQGGRRVTVRNTKHLAALLDALGRPGRWGVLEHPSSPRWAQSMRVPHGWIVEVDGGAGPDAFARRVRWAAGQPARVPVPRLRCTNEAGGRGATYFSAELIPSPGETAGVCGGGCAAGSLTVTNCAALRTDLTDRPVANCEEGCGQR